MAQQTKAALEKFDADATHDIRQDGDGLGLDIRVDGLSLKMAEQEKKAKAAGKEFDDTKTHDIRQDGDGLGIDLNIDGLSLTMAQKQQLQRQRELA